MGHVLPLLIGLWFLAVITPGPDFVVIVRYATTESRWHGVLTAVGSNCGIFLWAAGSMFGLSVVMARMSWLYDLIRLAGAAYLIYLGARTLWSSRRAARVLLADHGTTARSPFQAWKSGFLTNAANPKAAAFFGSLIGALMPAHPSIGFRGLVLALIVGTSVSWHLIVAAVFGSDPVVRVYRRIRRWIDRVTALVFITLGLRLAAER